MQANENVVVQESITKETENALYSNKVEEVAPQSEKPEASEIEVAPQTENKDEVKETTSTIDYELTLKEGSLLDPSTLEAMKSFAIEHKLSKEAAQAVLSNQEKFLEHIQKTESEQQDLELQAWRDSVVNDKVLGGANLAKTAENARKVVTRFGNQEFIKLLNETGYGDHPEMVRFLSQVGAMMSDDSIVTAKSHMAPRSAEELFYGTKN